MPNKGAYWFKLFFNLSMKVYSKLNSHVRVIGKDGNFRCQLQQSNNNTASLKITGEIDWFQNNAESIRNVINEMKVSGVDTLHAYINSPGGLAVEANEIYNIIKSNFVENNRHLTIGALCASAATMIASAFPKKNTKGHKNTVFMMHNHSVLVYGEERDLISSASLLKKLDENYRSIWSARMGVTDEFLKSKMESEWWLLGNELVQYNVIGSFIDKEDTEIVASSQHVLNKARQIIQKISDRQPDYKIVNGKRFYGEVSEGPSQSQTLMRILNDKKSKHQ